MMLSTLLKKYYFMIKKWIKSGLIKCLTAIFLNWCNVNPNLLNHQTQPFWVKGVWLVPDSQTLAGFGIGAFRLVTVGVFWFLSHPTAGAAQTDS